MLIVPVNTFAGPEAGIDRQDAIEAGQQHAGADQQHQREGDLAGDEHAAHQPRAAALRAAAALFANHLRHVGAAHRDHRNHPDADADQRDQQHREADDRRIEREAEARRQPIESEERRGAQRPPSEAEAGDAAGDRQHGRFGQRLPRQPAERRAHRMTRRQLANARGRSHEHEIGDVDAADQQHEDRAAPQHRQRRSPLADQVRPGSRRRRC